jgi:hypothetical protein
MSNPNPFRVEPSSYASELDDGADAPLHDLDLHSPPNNTNNSNNPTSAFYEGGSSSNNNNNNNSTTNERTSTPSISNNVVASGILGSTNIPSSPNTATGRLCGMFSVEYYTPYFEVTTVQVGARMKSALNPLQNDIFKSTYETTPDLYGPFWISTTLVFLIGMTSNLNSFLGKSNGSENPYHKDYAILSIASTLVYAYVTLAPVAVFASTKYWATSSLSLLRLFSVYGYAILAFVPASILCSIPSAPVQWIVVLLAILVSGIVLVRNLFGQLAGDGSSVGYDNLELGQVATGGGNGNGNGSSTNTRSVIAVALLLNTAFGVLLKLFFFQGAELSNVIEDAVSTSTGTAPPK